MTSMICVTCGHLESEHAELVQSKEDKPERRQCLHGVKFELRTDARGSMLVSEQLRHCSCEKFVPKTNKPNGKKEG